MANSNILYSATENRDAESLNEEYNEVYEIEKRIKFFLEKVFTGDRKFPFDKDEEKSKLKVVVEYPDIPDVIKKTPHLVISGINGRINPSATLFHNFYKDIYGDNGEILYQEQLYSYQFNATIFCVTGSSATCKDLGNKVQKEISISEVYRISELMGLNLESEVMVGPPVIRQQHPFRMFECAVSFAGRLLCKNRRKYADDNTKLSDATLENIVVKTKLKGEDENVDLEVF